MRDLKYFSLVVLGIGASMFVLGSARPRTSWNYRPPVVVCLAAFFVVTCLVTGTLWWRGVLP